jgi:hypothetical protein
MIHHWEKLGGYVGSGLSEIFEVVVVIATFTNKQRKFSSTHTYTMDSAYNSWFRNLSASDKARMKDMMESCLVPEKQSDQELNPINMEKEVLDISDEDDEDDGGDVEPLMAANLIKRRQLSKDGDYDRNDNSVWVSSLEQS